MVAKRIMIVDDHAVFRDGLAFVLEKAGDLTVCGRFEDGPSALKESGGLKPDMAILDVSLDGMNGIELTKTLRARHPQLKILILSMHKEFLYAERALRAGADGYIMKQESSRKLVDVVRRILKGETYVSEAVKELMLRNVKAPGDRSSISPVGNLSDRELEIFQLIARGFGTRLIANSLHLSIKTVETHREHIREKLNFDSTSELNQFAIEWNISQHA